MEIIDGIFNPNYRADKATAPNYIFLVQTDCMPKDISLCDNSLNPGNKQKNIIFAFMGVISQVKGDPFKNICYPPKRSSQKCNQDT